MRKYDYSDEIVDVVKRFLKEDDWHYSFDEDTGVFHFNLSIKSKINKISYAIDVHEDELVIYGISPVSVDPDDSEIMSKMMEFICRANYGLLNGSFELDMRDGEIRYKSFVDCDNLLPSTDVVRNGVHCTAARFKRYAAGIVDVIFGGVAAKEAIAKCEKPTEAELRYILEGALGENMSEEDVNELLSRLSSEFAEGNTDGPDKEGGATNIRLNPFESGHKDKSGMEPVHLKTDVFAAEGGEA